jgi:hypothetical protein
MTAHDDHDRHPFPFTMAKAGEQVGIVASRADGELSAYLAEMRLRVDTRQRWGTPLARTLNRARTRIG